MLVDDILSKILTNVSYNRDYYSFETFVVTLLRVHLESQNKPIQTDLGISAPIDAYAPEGFDNFVGPTAIEIKLNLGKWTAKLVIEKTLDKVLRLSPGVKNLLIISSSKLPESTRERIDVSLSGLEADLKVYFWGPDEFEKIVSKHQDKVNEIVDNLFTLRIESAVSKPARDWKDSRAEIIDKVRDLYQKGQFALFLGAGVSSSAGMPDWNTLLNSLFVTYLTKEFTTDTAISDADIKEIVERLGTVDEPSALMAARYLRRGLVKGSADIDKFREVVTSNLYKLRDNEKSLESNLIKAITALCMPRRTGAKIRSVTTYNFDDLLERQLKSSDIQYHSIYTDTDTYDLDELPVYHVHGFLPEDPSNYEGLDNSTLVFSEEGYHQIYSDAYHWSNLVQLNSLRECNCLLIGLSMSDPNLRRLLDIAARNMDQSKHFTFMKRMTKEHFCFRQDSRGKDRQVISNLGASEKFLERHHALNEELMKELGVTIIWYDSYEEIPALINKIREI